MRSGLMLLAFHLSISRLASMKGLDIIFAVMALMAACGIAYTRHSLSTMQRTRMVGPYLEGSAAGNQQRSDA